MSKSYSRKLLAGAAALMFAAASLPATAAFAADKPKIESAAQLPQKTYRLTRKPSELVTDAAAIGALAKQLDADVAAILDGYEIADRATLEGLYGIRSQVAVLEGRWADAAAWSAKIAAIREKPAEKAMTGLTQPALAAAAQATGGEAARRAAFRQALEARMAGLDYALVEARIKQTKGGLEVMNPALVPASLQATFDKVYEQSPELSRDMVAGLVGAHVSLTRMAPYKDDAVAVMNAWLTKHAASAAPRADIWSSRLVELPASAKLKPVVVAVWDSGVDTAVFQSNQLWRNPRETKNGRDDDGNGFVDDLNGIAFEEDWKPTGVTLRPIPATYAARMDEFRGLTKGFLDLQGAVDSPEAAALRQRMAGLKPEEVASFSEGLTVYSNYSHGTHVAGITAEGNPAARILPIRMTFPATLLPPPFDEAYAAGFVKSVKDSVAYMKRAGVRVANMSWGMSAPAIEATLEINRVEMDPAKRRARAQKIFDTMFEGMRSAMASAPEILFVAAAGNSNEDINFVRSLPGGIDLPNMVTVGAVDQTGGSTGFTSLGKSVDVYANGFEVVSYVPGGQRIKLSGTSMSAPQVTNAAAKLLAVNPKLTTAQVVDLLMKGASPTGPQQLTLLNPKRSLELAQAK